MWAAEKGQWEVCMKLAELGADLSKTDRVSETCSNCISVYCCCMIIILTLCFKLEGRQDGFAVGC